MTNPSAQTMLADELQRLKDVSDSTHDGDPYGGSDTQDALDQCIEDNFPTIISALRAASAPAAVREDITQLIEHHIELNTFNKNDDGSVVVDAAGIVLTLSEALATPEEASTGKQPICTHPNCSCAGRRCLAYDGSREETFTAAGEAVALQDSLERAANALQSVYDWYDRDGSVGGACAVFEENRRFLNIVRPAPPAAQTDGVREERIHLGDIVYMNERAPFHHDWRGVELKVVSLSLDPAGKLWASVVDSADRINHRGYGAYDGETTGIDACHLSALSRSPQVTEAVRQ